MRKNFEAFKLKHIIDRNGTEVKVKRLGTNEFGESTEEYTDVCTFKGLYHEINSYSQQTTEEGAEYNQKKKPMVMGPYFLCSQILIDDVIELSGKMFKVTKINNMGQENIIVDLSLDILDLSPEVLDG